MTKSDVSGQHWLLITLERLLAIEAIDMREALGEASDLVAEALGADKVDVFLYDPQIDTLVALGISHTPMARRQYELGLDRLPISNGGRSVEVYLTGESYAVGRADLDEGELLGFKQTLGIRSIMAVPMYVAGEKRGVVQVDSAASNAFSEYDLRFLQAVAGWIGTITHRAELIEQNRKDAQEEAKRVVAEELVTTIAHDLGNYLTPLIGRIELIRRDAEREGRELYAQVAYIDLGWQPCRILYQRSDSQT